MKVLAAILNSEGFDTTSLRVLFEQDGLTTFALTVDGESAVNDWERLRDLAPRTKRWPLLVGNPGDEDVPTNRTVWVSGKGEQMQKYPPVEKILKEAAKIDARALLDKWHQSNLANIREALAEAEAEGYDEDAEHWRSLLRGPEEFQGVARKKWPEDADPSSPFCIALTMTHTDDVTSKQVTLALLPTPHGWEAPAVMKFGNWNANPKPAEHVALLRYWHERYSADLVAMTHDVLEFMVAKPPRTRKEALRLAMDQYLYCEDIVDQGTYSLDALAARLLDGEAWCFWWD
jgi:hypothetical protein